MRVSRETMDRHHEAIVGAAARMLRERGVDGLSVADLMQAVGLTHGGFYRHFTSKDALVAEATRSAFQGIIDRLRQRCEASGGKKAIDEYVDTYLSMVHVEKPGVGCPVAAYGTDIARQSEVVREAYTGGLNALVECVGDCLGGPPQSQKKRALDLLTPLVGAIVTARAAADDKLIRAILAEAKVRAQRSISG